MERAVALEGGAEISLESLPPALQKLGSASAPAPGSEKAEAASGEGLPAKAWESAETALGRGAVNLEKIVGELEKEYIIKALERTGGVKKKAAELLGITFRSIRYRIAKYDIHDVEGDIDE
jgi:two-component system response regulator PilR (NtrC family)